MAKMSYNFRFLLFLCFLFPSVALAEENTHKSPSEVDISKLVGFNRWLVVIYNDHKWLYAILGLILVGIVALILSFLTDWIMGKLGYKSERMEHRE